MVNIKQMFYHFSLIVRNYLPEISIICNLDLVMVAKARTLTWRNTTTKVQLTLRSTNHSNLTPLHLMESGFLYLCMFGSCSVNQELICCNKINVFENCFVLRAPVLQEPSCLMTKHKNFYNNF